MLGAILCAVSFLIVVLSAAYLNTGFWATMVIATVVWTIAFFFIDFLEKQEKGKESKEDKTTSYVSDEATSHKFKLEYEFERLVSEIAHYNATLNEKVRVLVRKEGEFKDKVLISPEDMDNAFLEAIENLSLMYLTPIYDEKASLLERIMKIRELYEPKTP